jgi:anti-sigma factor RsiW
MNCEEATPLLGAYADGELDLTACVAIEAHLAACPACRVKVEELRKFTEALQEEAPRFKPSPFLATRIRAALREEEAATAEKSPWWAALPLSWIYYGVGGAVALVAVALFFAAPKPSSQLAHDAISDHVRSLQVEHLLDVASTDQHTVKPWFAGKLDFSPQVIDLTPSGYPLIGGRLDVLDHRNVAAIIYQRRKHYINLFVWPADNAPLGDRLYEQDGYRVFEWSKSGMNYVAVSELGEKELRDFTDMIKDQVVPPME